MSPANTLGLGISIGCSLAFIYYCWKQRHNNDPQIFYREKLANNNNARTVPPFGIFVKESEKDNLALLKHEMIHWRQFQREGLLKFVFGYTMEAAVNGYDGNKYEIEARENETDYCKENYTECVRNGRSNTVFNPEFRNFMSQT
ncbi:MAG: hypothetical protein COA79_20210 [Planctomycetota bacterium]|nr:MAG: hypothetical protein COA79_20210 [Planctomycetota bacterium]